MSKPTPPRRWPEHAENHRLDAVACLLDIEALTEQAQDAIAHGRNLEATMLVRQMRRRATSAKAALFKAREGVPSDGDEESEIAALEQQIWGANGAGGRP